MSTDATPSWSGYIFQGEVALCKAIEKINELGDNIQDSYCLKLEEDEDFSLLINNVLEVFQVKAYLTNDANRISKYKGVIEELISKYYYVKNTTIDPHDGRRRIHEYTNNVRQNPIKSFLVTDKEIIDYDPLLEDFDNKFRTINLSFFELIHGLYNLNNITQKIDNAILNILPNLNSNDLELKRNYCINKILSAIKERHRTGNIKSFSLIEIKEWILNSDLAFNEEIAWFSIIKKFFEILRRHIESYDEATENHLKEKLTRYYEELDNLQFEDIKILIKNRINSHKLLSKALTIEDITSYLAQNELNEIIIRCFEEIVTDPSFNNLTYNHNDNNYQLSLINININENSRLPQKTRLHEFCINIENNNLNEVNTIITQTLDLSKEQVNDILRDIMRPNDVIENESDKVNITDKNFKFQFKSVDNSINEINNG
jgi:hypothetical protein